MRQTRVTLKPVEWENKQMTLNLAKLMFKEPKDAFSNVNIRLKPLNFEHGLIVPCHRHRAPVAPVAHIPTPVPKRETTADFEAATELMSEDSHSYLPSRASRAVDCMSRISRLKMRLSPLN